MSDPRIEPSPRHVRAWKGGEKVVDSERAHLVWADAPFPRYAFPRDDVAAGLDLAWEGDDLVMPEPGQMDHWLEEDDPFIGHPHDPHHHVDARRSSREVEVRWDGTLVARSDRPTVVFETGLDPRFYLPRGDVRLEYLQPSDTTTVCPYKGVASYFSLAHDDQRMDDAAWSYETPLPDNPLLAGLIAFYQQHLEVTVDGEAV